MFLIPTILSGLVLIVNILGNSARSLIPPRCNDPARERLEELWRSHGTWHESIFQLDAMQGIATSLSHIEEMSPELVDIKQHALKDPSCPFGSGSHQEVEAYRRKNQGKFSLCPSYDSINYDENRIPSTLFEKRCSCKECAFEKTRHSHGSGNHTAISLLSCIPVYYYVKVLRRVRCDEKSNIFVYERSIEPLVEGCMCDQRSKVSGPNTSIHNLAHPSGTPSPRGVVRSVNGVVTEKPKKRESRRQRVGSVNG